MPIVASQWLFEEKNRSSCQTAALGVQRVSGNGGIGKLERKAETESGKRK